MTHQLIEELGKGGPNPSLSIVIPTWGDPQALNGTLTNIAMQADEGRAIEREVLVIGDGFEQEAKSAVERAAKLAARMNQNAKFWYYALKEHTGGGNYPRAAGLRRAGRDWVIFLDAGTALCHYATAVIAVTIKTNPEAKIVTWDMVQLTDPVPVTTTVYAVQNADRSKGLPYVFPGCATAVRRDLAQQVDWPDVPASDWAYFSMIWEKAFGPAGAERDGADSEVVLIPWTLTVAYAYRKQRKQRMPLKEDGFKRLGYDMGWQQAVGIKGAVDAAGDAVGEQAN